MESYIERLAGMNVLPNVRSVRTNTRSEVYKFTDLFELLAIMTKPLYGFVPVSDVPFGFPANSPLGGAHEIKVANRRVEIIVFKLKFSKTLQVTIRLSQTFLNCIKGKQANSNYLYHANFIE